MFRSMLRPYSQFQLYVPIQRVGICTVIEGGYKTFLLENCALFVSDSLSSVLVFSRVFCSNQSGPALDLRCAPATNETVAYVLWRYNKKFTCHAPRRDIITLLHENVNLCYSGPELPNVIYEFEIQLGTYNAALPNQSTFLHTTLANRNQVPTQLRLIPFTFQAHNHGIKYMNAIITAITGSLPMHLK